MEQETAASLSEADRGPEKLPLLKDSRNMSPARLLDVASSVTRPGVSATSHAG